jgi:hypothetical protein
MSQATQIVQLPPQPETIESMAAKRAESNPLPGSLGDAFLSGPITIAGHEVRKLVASDYVIFKFLDSPILRQLLELSKAADKQESVSFTDEEEWEMCWQFIHTPRECRELMKKGRESFRELCSVEIGDSFSPEQTKLIVLAISEQVRRNGDTAVKFVADAKEKGEITFFREPPAMDKAGG